MLCDEVLFSLLNMMPCCVASGPVQAGDGVEVSTVEEEGDSGSAPALKEWLHNANGDCFNSSFSFYLFTCIYW